MDRVEASQLQQCIQLIFERPTHDGMIMDNRVGSHAVSEQGILKILDTFRL